MTNTPYERLRERAKSKECDLERVRQSFNGMSALLNSPTGAERLTVMRASSRMLNRLLSLR